MIYIVLVNSGPWQMKEQMRFFPDNKNKKEAVDLEASRL